MIVLKTGVTWQGVQPEIMVGLSYVYSVFKRNGIDILTITSTRYDSNKHKVGSKHYIGQAIDIRSKDILKNTRYIIRKEVRSIVKPLGYDFILELEGDPLEHFHMEYDPK